MPANARYSWESDATKSGAYRQPDPNRSLKLWLVIAAGVSVVAHAALWMVFQMTTLAANSPLATVVDKTRTFKIDRVTIKEKPQLEERSLDDEQMAEILDTGAAPLVKEINEEDPNIYDKLPEHEVKLTTEVDDMSKFLASERPSVKGENNELTEALAPENIFTTEELEDAINAMKDRIKLPDRVSPEQTPIELEEEGEGLLMGNDLEAMNLALAKAAGNADITKGFSNLDDLLNRTGPLLDDTKPILIPTDLLFQFNQSDVQEAAKLSMMKLGLLIRRNQESKFIIEGHTDTLGPEEYNMTLSVKRAQSVQDWLVESLGLSVDRVAVKGFGETKPLVPTGDRDEQAINRRVEIAIRPVGS